MTVEKTARWHVMVKALGGDTFAIRIANCLHTEGLGSFRALGVLREGIGAPAFRSRMREIRGFGTTGVDRLEAALAAYRNGTFEEPQQQDEAFPTLPQGLATRLLRTVEGFDALASPGLKLLPGVPGSITLGDVRALARMLHGF